MSQKAQKILALILLAILLVAIPFTIKFGAQQEQQTKQNALTQVWNGGTDNCGKVHVAFENETPACTGGTAVTDSYTTTVRLTSADGGTHIVQYLFESFWCKDSTELGDGVNPTSCIKRSAGHVDSKVVTVAPGAGITVTSIPQVASSYGFGGSCGTFQTDFSFFIGSDCKFGYSALDPDPNHPVLAAGYCNTGQTCSPPTSTPTPTVPNTPTPTIPNTPTPPVTPTPTTTTPTPTGTTPTPTTVLNTPTPGPTATPMPPTPTPRPKPLPPTGPGDTILGIGLLGAAAAAIGAVVILAL